MTPPDGALRDAYHRAFAAYLARPAEDALRTAYELGRQAVKEGLSVLDLVAVHHDALAGALDEDEAAPAHVVRTAEPFLLESVASFEMVQRGYRETRAAAELDRRQAAIVRQLSTFLADTSLASPNPGDLEEVLRLTAEQACELLEADRAEVEVFAGRHGVGTVVASGEPAADGATVSVELRALDGTPLGELRVNASRRGELKDGDAAVLQHLAQMASAAVERAQHYRRSS